MSKGIEIVTVYRGKDSATYLLADFEKYGTDAEPITIRQYPGDSKPYHKMELEDVDGFYKSELPTKDDVTKNSGEWNIKALKKLVEGDNTR